MNAATTRQKNAVFSASGLCTLVLVCLLAVLGGCGFKKMDNSSLTGDPKGRDVVKTAYSQMGKRYRLGGDSPSKGFDCSGLIWWAYQKNGVKVPRITSDQAKAGVSVNKTRAAPGDIVVFRTQEGPRGLHTGIYTGNNTFIHSPRKGERVRMESMEIPYWKNKLSGVRRVLD